MAKKLDINPITGKFDLTRDYEEQISQLTSNLNTVIQRVDNSDERLEDVMRSLQGGQIIPAEREGVQELEDILCNVEYENYLATNKAEKFFVILDNPIVPENSGEKNLKLKIQTDKEYQVNVPPPPPTAIPNASNPFAGLIGYNAEKGISIFIDERCVFFALRENDRLWANGNSGAEVYDVRFNYEVVTETQTIGEGETATTKIHLFEYTEPTEETTEPTTPPSPVMIISNRNEKTVTFEKTSGTFGLLENIIINFGNDLIITQGQNDWAIVPVMLDDETSAKISDIVGKRSLMRVVIDENDVANRNAYMIGGGTNSCECDNQEPQQATCLYTLISAEREINADGIVTSWHREFSDGFVEMGGCFQCNHTIWGHETSIGQITFAKTLIAKPVEFNARFSGHVGNTAPPVLHTPPQSGQGFTGGTIYTRSFIGDIHNFREWVYWTAKGYKNTTNN